MECIIKLRKSTSPNVYYSIKATALQMKFVFVAYSI